MAFLWTKNSTPADGYLFVFALKALLKTAGWTVTRSGDGVSTYSASADILTTGAGGAGGLGNPGAWFAVKQPAAVTTAQRQICFQADAVGGNWRIKYSWNTGFTVGTSSATVTPSATDQVIVLGAGTDAAPTFSALLPGGYTSSSRAQLVANNAAPYEFAAFSYPVGGGTLGSAMVFDSLVAGSFDVLDVDPFVFYIEPTGSQCFAYTTFGASGTGYPGPQYWHKKGLSGAAFVRGAALYLGNNDGWMIPGNAGVNGYSAKDQIFPILYGRHLGLATQTGIKGQSSLLHWCSNQRTCGDTLTVLSTKDYLCLVGVQPNVIAVPWDGTTPTV